MKKETLLARLKSHSLAYKSIKKEFSSRLAELKNQFDLLPEQKREVDFGIIIPADRSLQKYNDILNSDERLNQLSDQLFDAIMKGCNEIFKEINDSQKYIPGYDLDEFMKNPSENRNEIINLMQGFGGYKHIHSIDNKIALEVPARRYLYKKRSLMRGIKYWLKTVDEFSMYN